MHALDVEALADPGLSFVSLRRDGELLGVGALKVYGDRLGELKSMHTVQAARGQGVASAIVEHLLGLARDRGLTTVNIETGSMGAFAPARALYCRHGFVECGPFADYLPSRFSTFLTLSLDTRLTGRLGSRS